MKTRYILTSLVLFCGIISSIQAQQDTIRYYYKSEKAIAKSGAMNKIYGELLGSGFGISANYERCVWQDDKVSLNARIGIGTAILINSLPILGFNACLGKGQSKFEVGINALRVYSIGLLDGNENKSIYANPIVGYRFESREGFLFRFAFTPFINPNSNADFTFFPWLGLSFGGAF
jgi:hypothetical protein